jgi:hypothetical protein
VLGGKDGASCGGCCANGIPFWHALFFTLSGRRLLYGSGGRGGVPRSALPLVVGRARERKASDDGPDPCPSCRRRSGGAREKVRPGGIRPLPEEGCGLPLRLANVSPAPCDPSSSSPPEGSSDPASLHGGVLGGGWRQGRYGARILARPSSPAEVASLAPSHPPQPASSGPLRTRSPSSSPSTTGEGEIGT